MTDYIGLIQGRLATTDARLGQVLSWLQDVRPGTPNLNGHGDYVDAWRHGGTGALLAYHHGYDSVKRWGDALEDYRPDNEQEFGQDIRNNEVGAKIGALARITGMTIPELGDAMRAAFEAGAFQTDAYAPFSGSPTFRVGNMTLSVGSGVVTLPDGSRFDLTKSGIVSDGDLEYPLLHVIRRDGSIQNIWTNMEDSRTLFQSGIGKWELPQSGGVAAASINDRFSAMPSWTRQTQFGQFPDNYVPKVPSQNTSVPWYSSPAVTGNFTPASNSDDTGSPVLRALEKRRSTAPDGLAPTSVQGAAPATPAFQQGATTSPGNFPRASAVAPASSLASVFDTGTSPVGIALALNLPGDEPKGIVSNTPARTLGRRVINQSGASLSEATVSEVPFVPPNGVLAHDLATVSETGIHPMAASPRAIPTCRGQRQNPPPRLGSSAARRCRCGLLRRHSRPYRKIPMLLAMAIGSLPWQGSSRVPEIRKHP